MRDPDRFLDQLFGLWDLMTQRHGWPARSEWWANVLTDAERSGTRQRVIRKPRRIGASTVVAPLIAVCEALHGQHNVPPNDVGYFLFFSVKKDEAAKRLRGIATVLDAIGEPYSEAGDTIELKHRPIAFKVQPASFRTAVGDTSIGIWCDEVARWLDADSGANPATEVLASVRPTLATMPNAKIWLVSSPLGVLDAHAVAFDAGDSSAQRTYWCRGTWLANPSVTEDDCRALELDERLFNREYKALPQASLSSAFDPDAVERAFRPAPAAAAWATPVCVVDASSGGGDSFTWTIAQYVTPSPGQISQFSIKRFPRQVNVLIGGVQKMIESTTDFFTDLERDARGNPIPNPAYAEAMRPTVVFSRMGSFDGRFAGSIAGSQIVETIAQECRRARVDTVIGDQRESFFLGSEFSRHKLRFVPIAWTNSNKLEAVTRLKRMFAEGTIVLPVGREKLKKELLSYAERITASGAITFSARGSGHDDECALLISFVLGELERIVPGSPMHIPNYRHVAPGR